MQEQNVKDYLELFTRLAENSTLYNAIRTQVD